MSAEERSAFAIAKKEAGNAAFKAKDYHEAAELYSDGARYITFSGGGGHGHGHSHGGEECHADHGGGESAPLEDAAKTIALNLLTNCAAARLKIGSADGAAEVRRPAQRLLRPPARAATVAAALTRGIICARRTARGRWRLTTPTPKRCSGAARH